MPRPLRLEYPGACYHVTNRGDRGDPVFQDDTDRARFLDTLAEACGKTGWFVHAYCLMPNHFHLVVETPQPGMVVGMKWLMGTYTTRFNRRHGAHGHLFGGRYKALPVASEGGFFRRACEHVHLNPARAGLLRPEEPLSAYPWSSYPSYLLPREARPAWLRVDRTLAAMQHKDDPAGRREFARRLERLRTESNPDDWAGLRRGWCFGDKSFRLSLLDRLASGQPVVRYGVDPPEAEVQKGEQIVHQELKRRGWTEDTLAKRARLDGGKLEVARRLRRETVLSLRWIAKRLAMGSANTLRNGLQVKAGPPTEPRAASAPPPSRSRRTRSVGLAGARAELRPGEEGGLDRATVGQGEDKPAQEAAVTSGSGAFEVTWD